MTEHNIAKMRRALDELPPLDRTMINLFYIEEKHENLAKLIVAAYREPAVDPAFEQRVMMEVARRAIAKARRRARFSLAASLSGATVAAAAAVIAIILWFPPQIILSIDVNSTLDTVMATIRTLLP